MRSLLLHVRIRNRCVLSSLAQAQLRKRASCSQPHFADDRLPNKISRQLRRIDWQAGPRQRPDILFNVTHAMQFSKLVFECEGARPLVLYDLIKARMSALMTSACVVIMPWGKPG